MYKSVVQYIYFKNTFTEKPQLAIIEKLEYFNKY